ncbi:hypothetical protein ACJX0J_020587, partial [Zea mays]
LGIFYCIYMLDFSVVTGTKHGGSKLVGQEKWSKTGRVCGDEPCGMEWAIGWNLWLFEEVIESE